MEGVNKKPFYNMIYIKQKTVCDGLKQFPSFESGKNQK